MTDTGTSTHRRIEQLLGEGPDLRESGAILERLGEYLGVLYLGLDESGSTRVELRPGLPLTLMYVPSYQGVLLCAPLPQCGNAAADVQLKLLLANGDWQMTGGGFFAMDPESASPLYCRALPLSGEVAELAAAIDDFQDFVEFWAVEIDLFQDLPDALPENRDKGEPVAAPAPVAVAGVSA